MKRVRLGFAAMVMAALVLSVPAGSASAAYKAPAKTKINVLGEWAHPDDDTSIIGPCGVWHQRYGVKCGLIVVTRREGGGIAVGTDTAPALGLRRENDAHVANYRSGKGDILTVDRVDLFYNSNA